MRQSRCRGLLQAAAQKWSFCSFCSLPAGPGILAPSGFKCVQLKSAKTGGRLLPFPSPTLHWTQNAMTSRLHFKVDGVILDQQDKKATQRLINEHFNTPLLRHAVFYGQNEVTSILEVGWV